LNKERGFFGTQFQRFQFMFTCFRVYCEAENHGWEHVIDGSSSAHGRIEGKKRWQGQDVPLQGTPQ
jgi:hypothetical protein